MAKTGRPSKLFQAEPLILAGIRRGLTYQAAAESANVRYRTIRNWIRRGEAELNRLGDDPDMADVAPDERPYLEFAQKMREARAQGELALADIVQASAAGGGEVRETRTVEMVDETGTVVKRETHTHVKTLPPDWRAAAFALERRFGWFQKRQDTTMDVDLSTCTDDELERIANGEDPLLVLADRSDPDLGSGTGAVDAEEEEAGEAAESDAAS